MTGKQVLLALGTVYCRASLLKRNLYANVWVILTSLPIYLFISLKVQCPKRGYCIPWNPTLPREVHGSMLIRNDLPLICRCHFSQCCVLWERTKSWGVWVPKRTISTQTGGVRSLQMVSEPCSSWKRGPHTRGHSSGGKGLYTLKGDHFL